MTVDEVMPALCAPFEKEFVEFLPRGKSENCVAMAYIDSRAVMARLDRVVGRSNWNFAFHIEQHSNSLVAYGVLTVLGVTASDVGESGEEGEKFKSVVSDALKRCAVHFGVGRYLYNLPVLFGKYDQQKKRWVQHPVIKAQDLARAVAMSLESNFVPPMDYAKSAGPANDPDGSEHQDAASVQSDAEAEPEAKPKPATRTRSDNSDKPPRERALAACKELGWEPAHQRSQLIAIIGREASPQAPLTEQEWRMAAVQLEAIAGCKRVVFQKWEKLRTQEGYEDTREARLEAFAGMLGKPSIESASVLTVAEWKHLNETIHGLLKGEAE